MKASEIIKIARAELGYREKESNSRLDEPKGNAGDENWTKYARDVHSAGFFNGNKNGYDWCTTFVTWCAWMAAGKDREEAERVLCQSGPYGAGCNQAIDYYREAGRYDGTPRVGDQIFVDWQSDRSDGDHTGIVVEVTGGTVTTIEGNRGDAVQEIVYARTDSRIIGYGHPRYEEESSVLSPQSSGDEGRETRDEERADTRPAPTKKDEGGKTVMVEMRQLSKGDKGADVKIMQVLVDAHGFSVGACGFDGDFGKDTESAVKMFQSIRGIDVDGIVGHDTWTELLEGVR